MLRPLIQINKMNWKKIYHSTFSVFLQNYMLRITVIYSQKSLSMFFYQLTTQSSPLSVSLQRKEVPHLPQDHNDSLVTRPPPPAPSHTRFTSDNEVAVLLQITSFPRASFRASCFTQVNYTQPNNVPRGQVPSLFHLTDRQTEVTQPEP